MQVAHVLCQMLTVRLFRKKHYRKGTAAYSFRLPPERSVTRCGDGARSDYINDSGRPRQSRGSDPASSSPGLAAQSSVRRAVGSWQRSAS